MSLINQADQQRISAEITQAEQRTSGEIVAVVTAESASHLSIPFMVAALLALLVPWPLIYLTWLGVQWIYAIQLVVFALVLAATLPRPIRFRLVPKSVLHGRAHRRAVEQFLTLNLHTTPGRTGVLIYVSVAERYAEIIADTALHGKVAPGEWQSIIDGMTARIGAGQPADGFIEAIRRVGALLAEHFPPGTGDKAGLPDHLVILD